MPNILINPSSGILEFNTGTAGSSSLASLSGAARLSFQNSGELNLTSYSTATVDRFSIDGSAGRLFSVSDALTGTIFSVNDIAGLPLIEVNSNTDDTITLGTYSTNALVVKNDKVGVGTATPASKLDILDTTLAGSGSLSGSALNIAQTWNTSGTPTAIKLDVTDTASNAASLLMDLRVGGASKFKVNKNSQITLGNSSTGNPGLYFTGRSAQNSPPFISQPSDDTLTIYAALGSGKIIDIGGNGYGLQLSNGFIKINTGIRNVYLSVDGDNHILAQRNGTNAQTFRLYNTYTDASNYERGYMRWNSNVLEIGTEAAGSGQQRKTSLVNAELSTRYNYNTGYTDGSGWLVQSGWTNNGDGTFTSDGTGSYESIRFTLNMPVGEIFLLKYDIISYTSGNTAADIAQSGDSGTNTKLIGVTNAVNTVVFQGSRRLNSQSQYIGLRSNQYFVGTIGNIKIEKL